MKFEPQIQRFQPFEIKKGDFGSSKAATMGAEGMAL